LKFKSNNTSLRHVPVILALLTLCTFTTGAGTLFFNIPAVSILWHLTGALFFLVFIRLRQAGHSRPSDYIQSGEAVYGSLVIIFVRHLAGAGPYLTLIVLVISFILFELYLHGFLKLKERELLYSGIFLTMLFFVFILFLELFDGSFSQTAMLRSFIPREIMQSDDLYALPGLAVTGGFLYILLKLVSPELSLLSHGRHYFKITGIDFNRTRIFALIAGGIAASGFFSVLGWTAGAVSYLLKENPERSYFDDVVLILLCVFYTQSILLFSQILSPYLILLVIFSLSWGMYLYTKRGRIRPYDRIA